DVEGAGGHRGDDVLGGAPSKLLGDLVGEGLSASGVGGAHVDLDEGRGVLVGELGAEAVDVVVVAIDGDEGGAVDAGADDLASFEVAGDEDVGLEAGGRGVGGD